MQLSRVAVDSGQVWHVTQRCHGQRFLLHSEVDRRRWVYWLYQARRLHGLSVLNYMVTSNHVHLLVRDTGRFCLPASMQLIKARTTAEYAKRHCRKEPLWEAGFTTTAIQTQSHLARCLVYMDLNMVRAGVVDHPQHWRCSGYREYLHPCKRVACIDREGLRTLLRFSTGKALQGARDSWINQKLDKAELCRESYWSDSIAVGDLAFALKMKRALAYTHPGRRAQREAGCFAVR